MNRKLVALFALGLAGLCTAQDQKRPNVVLVMTDDQGLGDFGCQGNPVLATPRLDAFSRQCPQFERFYVSLVCSPTRLT